MQLEADGAMDPASTADGHGDLVKLATRLILEEALEAESHDVLSREYCAHGAEPASQFVGFVDGGARNHSRSRM